MKYKIWEMLLAEYDGAPDRVMIDEIEAETHEQAYAAALLRNPGRTALRVDDGETAYEFQGLFGQNKKSV